MDLGCREAARVARGGAFRRRSRTRGTGDSGARHRIGQGRSVSLDSCASSGQRLDAVRTGQGEPSFRGPDGIPRGVREQCRAALARLRWRGDGPFTKACADCVTEPTTTNGKLESLLSCFFTFRFPSLMAANSASAASHPRLYRCLCVSGGSGRYPPTDSIQLDCAVQVFRNFGYDVTSLG